MNYEKKYKEALEIAQKLYQDCPNGKNDRLYHTTDLEKMFPELRESEDERIRKELIEFVKSRGGFKQEYIAWLEKQGSQNNTEDEDLLYRFCFYSYKDESNILYLSGLYVNGECRNKGIGTKILEVADEVAKNLNCYAIRLKTKIGSNAERLYRRNGYNTLIKEGNQIWLEKQGEQKHDNKVKPKFKVGDKVIGIVSDMQYYITDVCYDHYYTESGCIIMFCSQDNFKLVEQKPAWSEEEKGNVDIIVSRLEVDIEYWKSRSKRRIDEDKRVIDWLKSLKGRAQPQPKQEWSEEDQNALEDVREAVVHYWGGDSQDILLYWLKSIKQKLKGE